MKAKTLEFLGWLRRERQTAIARLVVGATVAALMLPLASPFWDSDFLGMFPGLQQPTPLIDPPDLR